MNLSEIRRDIDQIDQKIVKLLAERLTKAVQIANYKKERQIAQFQPTREKQLLAQKREIAKELGLNEDFVEELH